jgi:hypothetical protein
VWATCIVLYRLEPCVTNGVWQLTDKRRFSYQITNLFTNAFLGLLGVYYQCFLIPRNATVEQKIQGQLDFCLFGSIHIGFQLWSLVMGIYFVQETTQMLMHHVAVIAVSSKGVFFTNGFRYYAPLGLGMMELSSVPLALMNSFKNNQSWIDTYPQFYTAIHLVFSFTFLIIRIGMFVPQHLEYLLYSFILPYVADADRHLGFKVFCFANWIGAVFLLLLQLYWGYLIMSGMFKFFLAKNGQSSIARQDKLDRKKT